MNDEDTIRQFGFLFARRNQVLGEFAMPSSEVEKGRNFAPSGRICGFALSAKGGVQGSLKKF